MKKVFAILLSVLLVCALATAAFAAFEGSSCALTAAKTELKRGETFSVTAELTNQEAIKLATTLLTYDSAVLEFVDGTCHVAGANPATVGINFGKLTGTMMVGNATVINGGVFTFNFKVKDDAAFGTTTIVNKTSIGVASGSYIDATGLDVTVVCDHSYGEWTDNGANHKQVCSACGDEKTADHTFGAWTANGANHKATCSVCNAEKTEAHTEVVDAAVAATCTAAGKTEGKHCSVCNEVTVAQETVAKLPHTEVVDAAVAATCTEAGKTEGKHCSVCGTVTVAQETVAKLPHTEVVDAPVAATCTEAGKTEGKHCSVCGTVTVAQKVVDALGHKFDKKVVSDENKAADATCTSGATYYLFCSVCDTKSDSETFEDGDPIAHTFDKEVVDAKFLATAATCKAKATYFKSCECGEKGTETFEAGELAEHKYGEGKITVEPTEEKAGVKVYTCEVCGDEKTEEVPYVETPATGDVLPVVVLAVLAVCGMAIVVMKKRAI